MKSRKEETGDCYNTSLNKNMQVKALGHLVGGDCWRRDNTIPWRAPSSFALNLWASRSTKAGGVSTIRGNKGTC